MESAPQRPRKKRDPYLRGRCWSANKTRPGKKKKYETGGKKKNQKKGTSYDLPPCEGNGYSKRGKKKRPAIRGKKVNGKKKKKTEKTDS